MYDYRPILRANGLLLTFLGLAMAVPALVDVAVGNIDWQVFTAAGAFCIFIGVGFVMATQIAAGEKRAAHLSVPQAFMLTVSAWVMIGFFGALPFAFSDLDLSLTDALFESFSGITTTGATVITGLDTAPPGILLWRSILQWLGGIGIVVMAIAVLPMLQVGGMQLFRLESSDASDKILPRATQIAAALSLLYLALTLICIAGYWGAGMSAFDAVAHAMTTIATGGYSTHDQSMAYFDSAAIDTIATVFMILGSLPFVLYLQAVRGGWRALFYDDQVRAFLLILLGAIACITMYLAGQEVAEVAADTAIIVSEDITGAEQSALTPRDEQELKNATRTIGQALRMAMFNVVSVMTGTGYATDNYGVWGTFPAAFFFILMFIGGCAGSTSCGIKIFRYQVVMAAARVELGHLIRPHAVLRPRFNGRPVPAGVTQSVMSFFVLFAAAYGLLVVALAAIGLDATTALSGAAAAIANVGPGLGDIIGPAGHYGTLPDTAKWVLMAGMLLGRLELFTVLVFFLPAFWRG